MKINAAVCLVVKDEISDVAEWVVHYAGLGFRQLLIYDDGSTDGTADLLQQLAAVEPVSVTRWEPTEDHLRQNRRQLGVYEDACRRVAGDVEWLFCVDADEFLIPPDGGTLIELLSRHRDHAAFVVNTRIFGSAGLDQADGRLVMEAFDRRAPLSFQGNRHVKMFCRPETVVHVLNPHFMDTGRPVFDVFGRAVDWHEPGFTTPAGIVAGDWALHHYFTRSRRHWERRMARTLIDNTPRSWRDFEAYDRNDVIDLSALPSAALARARLAGHGIAKQGVPAVFARSNESIGRRQETLQQAAPVAAKVECRLDEFERGRVKGWACHPPSLPSPISMRVCVDGAHLFDVIADQYRWDVEKDIGVGNLGYEFRLPQSLTDAQPHRFTLQTEDGGTIMFCFDGVFIDHLDFTLDA